MRSAGQIPEIGDRLADIAYQTAVTDSPILPGTLSWFDYKLCGTYAGGDHTIFVGEVIAGDIRGGDGAPSSITTATGAN